MTFNQWCSGKDLNHRGKMALERVWNELIGSGSSTAAAVDILNEIHEIFRERR